MEPRSRRTLPGTARRAAVTGAAAAGAAVAAAVLAGGTAWAAGSGYGPTPGSTTPVPGGFTTVVTSQTVPTSGGSVQGSVGPEHFALDVPSGDFPSPVQITVTTPAVGQIPHGVTGIDISFAVGGQSLTGTLTKPVTLTIDNSGITATDVVEIWNGTAFVPYGQATTGNGSVTITFNQDPVFEVVSPANAAAATVPNATTVHTGVPVLGESLLAVALAGLGAAGLLALRRRSSRAAS